jgi:hypothetical protein
MTEVYYTFFVHAPKSGSKPPKPLLAAELRET